MNLFTKIWHFCSARQLPTSTAASLFKVGGTECILQNLQQLCATLPQGEAEVWLRAGQIHVSLHWQPKEKTQGFSKVVTGDSAQDATGLYFVLNGQNQEVGVAEFEVESPEKVQADREDACGHAAIRSQGNEPLKTAETEQHTDVDQPTDISRFTEAEENEKPSKQLKALKRLLDYLQLHYAFRYNRLTDRTECALLPEQADGASHKLVYQPVDNRVLNSISMQVLLAGIPCWDRDVKRYVESAAIPSYHPFTQYMQQLPEWDGVDRVTSLAQRVSMDDLWVRSFHRWMLATTAQWMNAGDAKQRANSVAPLLVSTRQGLGKSTFCRLLLPTCLQDYFTESFDLTNPSAAENKLASFGLINLDEFDRLPAGRMPQLKNLMQMERLHIRRAYKHSGEPLPRIASFIGTSNRRDLLTDRSGSRRFICVEVEHSIDCSTPIAYEQLYAQLKHELEHGERSWFSKKEEAEIQQANEAFYRTTPAEEILGETFALAEPGEEGAHFLSAAQIYTSLKSKNPSVLHDCTPLAFSKLMAQMGKRVHTKYGNGYWVKYRE